MRILKCLLAAAAMTAGLSGTAHAETLPGHIPFGTPKSSGTGCPQGTIAFAPTESAFTVLFDSYVASAGVGSSKGEATKFCFIKIPVTVPAGYQIKMESVDYRGYANVTKGASAQIQSWFLITGKGFASLGQSKPTRLVGAQEVDFFRRDVPGGKEKSQWSPCGGKFELHLASYVLTAATKKALAYVAVDSADGAVGLRGGVAMRKCQK